MRFRPCIDLHEGRVKQIVGGTLSDSNLSAVVTNFVSEKGAGEFAALYRANGLIGGHVIMLGPGNEAAAKCALSAYPGGLQVGGGIALDNAEDWLACGAEKVIVTSAVFKDGRVDWQTLRQLAAQVGRQRLVLDLSCRLRDGRYFVVTDRWQRFTDVPLGYEAFAELGRYCSEFLIHAVDVEGMTQGIDETLLTRLAHWCGLPATYAGGVRNLADLLTIERLGGGRIDATAGSSLDIFGGTGLSFDEVVDFDRARRGGQATTPYSTLI